MSHVTNVHVHSEDRQCMQYNDKNERKKNIRDNVKKQRGTNDFLCISVTFGHFIQVHVLWV